VAVLVVGAGLLGVHPAASAATAVGPRPYYLALGDSLAYGFQPDLRVNRGYADDFYADLQPKGTAQLIDMACPAETTATFLGGGCPFARLVKYHYSGPQMDAAISFITQHPGQVSPVTIDIGADDVLPLLDPATCAISPQYPSVLSAFDANFQLILSRLQTALDGSGDLITMNYYDPYQNQCARNPLALTLMQVFNAHLAADAAAYGVPVADVFTAFGGATTPNPHICPYTWMCSVFHDIHATTQGYAVIASTIEATAGY
jgi:lysophospholipase L1-like esterase